MYIISLLANIYLYFHDDTVAVHGICTQAYM